MSTDGSSTPVTDAWLRSSGYFLDGVLAVNRAAFAAFGLSAPDVESADESMVAAGNGEPVAGAVLPDCDVSVSVTEREAIDVGDSVRFERTLTDPDVRSFALTSGDTNPLHLDDAFAAGTRFDGRIAHGTLVSGLISAALARLPGLVVYLSQDLEFRSPVRIGDRAVADCEIVEDLGDYRYRLSTTVRDLDTDEVAIDGEAVILLDEAPAGATSD
jgi:3-hydroxybutyryl-CoA dehydratase